MKRNDSHPGEPMHPGIIIKMELKARGISQKKFAEMIGLQPSHFCEILKGNRSISNQMSVAIGNELHIPPAHIMKLQAEYGLRRDSEGLDDAATYEAQMLVHEYDRIYDMKTITRHMGISDKNAAEIIDCCRNLLHFTNPKHQERMAYGFYHKSGKTGLDLRMIATWSVLAQYEAEKQPAPVGRYDRSRLDDLSVELAAIFNDNSNTVNRVSRKLSEYGIRFCEVPKVEHASIDGYSFFISSQQPAIVITRRFNRIDNMAFAVLHEVGHLKLHLDNDGCRINIADADELCREEELEANDFAANALIPEEMWSTAPATPLIPKVIQNNYSAWAKAKHLNKWIVLGRVSHDTGMYMFKSDKSREIL